jgi:outer membrane protein
MKRKKNKLKTFCSLLSVFLCYQITLAQDTISTSALRWDLPTAINYARQHNIQLNITRMDERLAEQDLLQSRAARYPNLNGSLSQTFTTHTGNTNPVIGGFQTQSNLAGNYGLNSSVTLYRGGYLRYDIQSRTLQLQAANINASVAENDITLQVTQAYLNVLLAKENIIYIDTLLASSQEQYNLGKIKYDAGAISKKDLLQLEAQLAGDQYDLVTAQNQYRENLLTLKQILQLPTNVTLEPVVPDSLMVEKIIPALQEAQSVAVQNRPEIQYNKLQMQIAETELEKARSGYKPTVSVNGALSTGYSDNQDIKYFSQLNNNLFQRFGVTVGIPIFDNRVTKTNVERSKILIDQARLNLEQTTTVLNQQVEQAYIAELNAQAQYRSAAVQLRANQETYAISLEQLKLGAINTVDLLLIRNQYIQALQNYIQAKYNAVLNLKIYEFYTGIPVTL